MVFGILQYLFVHTVQSYEIISWTDASCQGLPEVFYHQLHTLISLSIISIPTYCVLYTLAKQTQTLHTTIVH